MPEATSTRTPVNAVPPGHGARPRTGVGTPDSHVEAAGLALGGDTGDVGTPRDTIGGDIGGTSGTTDTPAWSTIWREGQPAGTQNPDAVDDASDAAA